MFAMVSATKACRLTTPARLTPRKEAADPLDFVPSCRTTSRSRSFAQPLIYEHRARGGDE